MGRLMHNALLLMLLATATTFRDVLATSETVKLVNNSYTGIVIAINPDIPENMSILAEIQSIWGEASAVLYTATKKRAYFGEITILVPKSWNTSTYERAVGETYDKADVVIASPNRLHKDRPYTVQNGQCGEPGSYIHLTPEYLISEKFTEDFGPKSKAIAHEWAHLRWGVFDETSDTEENQFYLSATGDVEATRCPKSLEGEYIVPNYETGEISECSYDPVTFLPNSSCIFFLYDEQPLGQKASLMSHHALENVELFCHSDPNDPVNLHNADAPNDQNRLCGDRSVWDVIMGSPDFAAGLNPPNPNLGDATRPMFRIVKPFPFRRYVLVLDTSGSMWGERILMMRQAVSQFVKLFVEAGDHVGIVSFASFARPKSQLKPIETDEHRDAMLRHVPSRARGSTCIGCGIKAAMSVMDKSSPDACGDIIVFTDGEETQAPYVSSVVDEVQQKKCRLSAIFLLNPNGNAALQNLVKTTGGEWFASNDENDIRHLIGAFGKIASNIDGDATKKTSEVHSNSKVVEPGTNLEADVKIDKFIGNNTKFTFTWLTGEAPDVTLTSPHKCHYTTLAAFGGGKLCGENPLHEVNEQFKTLTFKIPGTAKIGTWHYSVATLSVQTITATVSSKSRNASTPPINVESGTKKDPKKPGCIVLYARVTVGGVPLTSVEVVATITKPDSTEVLVDLFDKGAAPDTKANDGVYTRCFNGANANGRLGMRVEVKSGKETVVGDEESIDSTATFNPGFIRRNGTVVLNKNGDANRPRPVAEDESTVDSTTVGGFTRVVTSEGFFAEGLELEPDMDSLPPSSITDLRAKQKNVTDPDAGIQLTFSAPGDDYDSGTAASYIIHYAIDDAISNLRSSGSGEMISDLELMEGDLGSPQEAGNKEIFHVRTPSVPDTENVVKIGFTVTAIDETGNEAGPSNVAVLNLYKAPPVIPTLPPIINIPPRPTTPPPTRPPSPTQSTTDTDVRTPVLRMKQTFLCHSLYTSSYLAAYRTACRYHASSASWEGCRAAKRRLISLRPDYKNVCGDVDYISACKAGYDAACDDTYCHTCYSPVYKPSYSLYRNGR